MPTTSRKTKRPAASTDAYTEGVGRRKTAIARVRIYKKGAGIIVNTKEYHDYFKRDALVRIVKEALDAVPKKTDIKVEARVHGGGIQAQAEAVRHGIARALVAEDPETRKQLRSKNLLTRDSRMKERRKFGLKKARKAPQWSKR